MVWSGVFWSCLLWSGLVWSTSDAVPHKTGPFCYKLQLVQTDSVCSDPNQLPFSIKMVHSIPCRSWSGPVRSSPAQSSPVRSSPVQSKFGALLHKTRPFRSKRNASPVRSGSVRSESAAVPHKAPLFCSKPQPVWSGPVQLAALAIPDSTTSR